MRAFLLLLLLICATALAHDTVTPKPKLLQRGIPQEGISGHTGESLVFKFVVPQQAENLVFKTSGGRGDVDVYARRGVYPTRDDYDAASRLGGNREEVRLSQPEEGIWYVLLDAFQDFSDVRLSAGYHLQRGAIDLPRCIPGPGVFAGSAVVQLKCATRSAVVRYTLDGSEPTSESPAYSHPLVLAADTRLRARAFGKRDGVSPETDAWYDVRSSNTVTSLDTLGTAHHLAGMAASAHIFKVTTTGKENRLTFASEGGTGKTEFLAKYGAPPDAKSFDQKSDLKGNRATITLSFPLAGEWYVSLRGLSSFSGVSVSAIKRADAVDLIAWQPALQPYIDVETFSAEDCEVQEGMTTAGTHTLLRFNTETRNIGARDLVMPNPEGNPAFEYAECHGHYHFKGFARYRLLDTNGLEVATGRKVSFCLLDLRRWDPSAEHVPHFDCAEQGIQAGWADVYDSGLPGQWIDISGIAPGTYTLEVTMNPDRVIEEADYSNNSAAVQVVIE